MFGWFSGNAPKFDGSLLSPHVSLTKENCRAFHSNEEDLGGVLFLNPALSFENNLAYFEVKVEVTRDDEDDGLTMGVTTQLPASAQDLGCADDVDFSWSLGYDGRAHIHGAHDLLATSWNPSNLKRGDIVGFLVSADGAACVLVNKEIVVTLPGVIPADQPLFGIVDLLGNCQGVLLNENSKPPEEHQSFSLSRVREDVLEEMYNAIGERNDAKTKAAMILARQLGVDELILKGAEKAIKSAPRKSHKKSSAAKENTGNGSARRSKNIHAAPSDDTGSKKKGSLKASPSPSSKTATTEASNAKSDEPPAVTSNVSDEAKREALNQLENAINGKDLEKIRSALKNSALKGVDAPEISRGKTVMQELEQDAASKDKAHAVKSAAAEAMDKALKSQDMGKIKASVDAAKSAGVDESAIEIAEKTLKSMEARAANEEKIKALTQAMNDAVASKDVGKITAAIREAQDNHCDPGDITQAEYALKKLELIVSLDEALRSEDLEKVKDALAKAKEGGCDASDITRGQEGVHQLEAEKELSNVMRTTKLADIKAAISKAKDAKVKASVIEEAEKRAADLQRRIDEAREKLQKEMDTAKKVKPPTVEMMASLAEATKAAADAGVDTKEAEGLHLQMVEELAAAKREAEDDLRASVSGKNSEVISKAIKKCKLFGSTGVVSEALDALSKLAQAEIDPIRDAEKSVKQEKLPMIESLVGILRENQHASGKKLHNDVQDLKGALRVFCRIRPLNKRELAMNDTIAVESIDGFTVTVNKDVAGGKKGSDHVETFSYDSTFVATNSQEDVFEECKGLIQSCFDGYNVTIFTYGQTGAGKTWTLYGIPEQPGVSPRTCESVFEAVDQGTDKFEYHLSASMVELYNSNVRDLLTNAKEPPKLEIKQEKKDDGSLAVKLDCVEIPCKNSADLTKAVEKGFGNRKVTATAMNADSSRSHLLFMIFVKVKDRASGRERIGKITIVDLAGSERIAKSQVTGDAQKEAIEINKSLTALGDVMMAITSRAKMVPYRNHKLTQLMQDSLGGTAKTLMFVNISPASNNADETINALKYAARARSIENETGGDKKKSNPKAKVGSAGAKSRAKSNPPP